MFGNPKKGISLNESQFIAQQFHKDPPSYPISARQGETKLYDINLIQTYFKINKPILSKQKRDVIEETLQLQKQARKRSRSRMKNKDYFVQYDYNPFAQKENARINRSSSDIKLNSTFTKKPTHKEEAKQQHIVDALRSIKNNQFRRDREGIMQTILTTATLSSKINRNAKNLHYNLNNKSSDTKVVIELAQAEITLDQIVKMEDRNYFQQKQEDINIFEFMFGNYHKIINREILNKHHFSFASNVENIARFKLPIHRDLSKFGRTLSIDKNVSKSLRLQALNSFQLSFKATNILFTDLISVASGRIDPPLAYSILFEENAQRDHSPNSSHFEPSTLFYKQNQRQQRINCNDSQGFRQQNIDYLKLEDTLQENRYKRKYGKVHENVLNNTDEVVKILTNNIKDKKLHKQYNELINADIVFLNNLDNRHQPQTEKYIRTNKRKKNRQQRMKIHTLLSTLQLRNQYHQRIKEIIKDKEKAK